MTEEDIEIIRESWARVHNPAAAASAFYARLFATAPALADRFGQSDMKAQCVRLGTTLDTAISLLDDTETLVGVLHDLGARHAGYGVQPSDYMPVGAALLWTLEFALGDAWDDRTESAWARLYDVVATTMRRGQERIAA